MVGVSAWKTVSDAGQMGVQITCEIMQFEQDDGMISKTGPAQAQAWQDIELSKTDPLGAHPVRLAERALARLWLHLVDGQEHMFRALDQQERRAFPGTLQHMLANPRQHDF